MDELPTIDPVEDSETANASQPSEPVDGPYESSPAQELATEVRPSSLRRPVLRLVGRPRYGTRTLTIETPHAGTRLALAQDAGGRGLLSHFSEARDLVTYVSGAPGTGKSTLLLHLALEDIEQGRACCVIDPHGDLVGNILRRIPLRSDTCSRVIVFDPADSERPVGLDILDAKTEAAQDLAVQFMFELYEELFLPDHQGPVLHQSLSNAMRLAMETGGTLAELPLYFTDRQHLARRLGDCRNPWVKHYFEKVWGQVGAASRGDQIAYFVSKLARFLDDRVLRNIFGQKDGIDLGSFFAHGGVFLAHLSSGAIGRTNARILGMVLMHRLARITMERAALPPEERTPLQIYVDEFHEIATPQLYQLLLPSARKFRVGITLANPRLDSLRLLNQQALLGAAGHLFLFRQGADPSLLDLSELFWPRFEGPDFLRLPNFKALAHVTRCEGEAAIGRIIVPECGYGDPKIEATLRSNSRRRHGHDRRIVEADILTRLGWGPPPDKPDEAAPARPNAADDSTPGV